MMKSDEAKFINQERSRVGASFETLDDEVFESQHFVAETEDQPVTEVNLVDDRDSIDILLQTYEPAHKNQQLSNRSIQELSEEEHYSFRVDVEEAKLKLQL
jgi:hypothetical protein